MKEKEFIVLINWWCQQGEINWNIIAISFIAFGTFKRMKKKLLLLLISRTFHHFLLHLLAQPFLWLQLRMYCYEGKYEIEAWRTFFIPLYCPQSKKPTKSHNIVQNPQKKEKQKLYNRKNLMGSVTNVSSCPTSCFKILTVSVCDVWRGLDTKTTFWGLVLITQRM